MSVPGADRFDVAVLGSSASASLIAGLLATEHGRKVALVGRRTSLLLPPAAFDVSIAPATRPETWALLRDTTTETVRLLGGLGKTLAHRVDLHFRSTTQAGADALAHMRHVAAGFGYQIEQLAAPAGALYRYQGLMLDRARVPVALGAWCERGGVARFEGPPAAMTIRREGVHIEVAGTLFEAERAILADDASIAHRFGTAPPAGIVLSPAVSVLLGAAESGDLAYVHDIDTGASLGRTSGHAIAGLAPGTRAQAEALVGALLGGHPRRRGGVLYHILAGSSDGAPVAAAVRGSRLMVIAGFGSTGAFFTPAIARHIAGAPAISEAGWFAARDLGKGRGAVAEFCAERVVA